MWVIFARFCFPYQLFSGTAAPPLDKRDKLLLQLFKRVLTSKCNTNRTAQSQTSLLVLKSNTHSFIFCTYCLICLAFSLSLTSTLSISASIFFFALSNFFKARFFFLALASITFLIGRTLRSCNFFL